MPNIPTALKWLAENRARKAFDLAHTEKLVKELQRNARVLRSDLEALDRTIVLYDKRIDPTQIQPVNWWKGRYGKRGGLRDAVAEVIRAEAPHWVLTTNIEAVVRAKFNLDFATKTDRTRWHEGGFRSAFDLLRRDGLIESDRTVKPGRPGRWRWKGGKDCSPDDQQQPV